MRSYSPCVKTNLRNLPAQMPHRPPLCLILLRRWQNAHSVFFVRKFYFYVLSYLRSCHFSIFLCHVVSNLLAWDFRVPRENAILRRCMSSSPSKTFELLIYAARLANLLAEAPSPPSSRIRPFNKLIEDFLDIEADEGKDSDRNGSPSCWLRIHFVRFDFDLLNFHLVSANLIQSLIHVRLVSW